MYVKGQVLWELGDKSIILRGGLDSQGFSSRLKMASIIACDGKVFEEGHIPLCNKTLFKRDNHQCLYCGHHFNWRDLSLDHIKPRVQGAPDIWMNVATACKRCNSHKGGCTPEEANMPMIAVPFQPNLFKFLFLISRDLQRE